MEDEIEIKKTLKSIMGLNENEITIYLDLIKYNNSSALEISKRTKIHRPNIYDTLRRLTEKGFVSQTIKDSKMIFSAINPEKIKDYLKQKQQEADSIIPKIKNIMNKQDKIETVSVTNGVFALRSALLGLIELNKPIKAIVGGLPCDNINTIGEGFAKNFHMELSKRKIPIMKIYTKEIDTKIKELNDICCTKELNNICYSKSRYFIGKENSNVVMVICRDIVLIILLVSPVSVIKIKNQEIADAYDRYFNVMWEHASE